MPPPEWRRPPLWWFVVLLLVTLAAYRPAWHGDVLWDDDAHLIPPTLASWSGLARIWTDPSVSQQYYPVLGSAFWLMNALWGHDTLGYHLVNIVLHACSAGMLALLLRRWSLPGALTAAVLFALHPVHVESVAWITELKNTLSTAFCLLATWCYLDYAASRSRGRYTAALVLFVLALGSKTACATLPAALLVLLWWRRGRIDLRADVLPLVPFFLVAAGAGVCTAWIEYAQVGAQGGVFAMTFAERTLVAGRALWFYLGKLLWPADLVFTYPRWQIDAGIVWQWAFPLAAGAALGALWLLRRRTRGPLAAALLFTGTLVPALGFFNVYAFRFSFVADHFQYLASLAVLAAVAVALVRFVRRDLAVALVLGAPLFVLTRAQCRQYENGETLYRTILAANPQAAMAHNNLAVLLLAGPAARWPEAAQHAEAAVAIEPDDAGNRDNLGLVWQRLGRFAEAENQHRRAIELEPRLACAHQNLGLALAGQGRLEEAMAAHVRSVQLPSPTPAAAAAAHHAFARTLEQAGRLDDAVTRLRTAIDLEPASADLRLDLANLLQQQGDFEAAIAAYRQALQLAPQWGEAHHNLAIALSRAGRPDESAAAFAQAERLLPDAASVFEHSGMLLASAGRLDEAAARFERALDLAEPTTAAGLHYRLGLVRERQGRRDDAARRFEAALRLQADFPAARDALEGLRAR